MRKILMIALILLSIGAVIFVAVMTYHGWDFKKLSAGKYETNTHTISDDFDSIKIETETADISILPSQSGECKVVLYELIKAKHTVTVENGTLKIGQNDERRWYDYLCLDFNSPKITLYLPEAEYGTLTVNATTGDVSIPKDFAFGDIDVSITTGDIYCAASTKGDVNISATTGDITLNKLKAGSVNLSVTTGDINADGIDCLASLTLKTTSGDMELSDIRCGSFTVNATTADVELKNVISEGSLFIKTTTGDIELEGCDATELYIKATTGDIEGNLLTPKTFISSTTTGNISIPKTTGGKCELHTTTGDIVISVKG